MFKRILDRFFSGLQKPLTVPKQAGGTKRGQAYRSILTTEVVKVRAGRRRISREYSYHATKGWRGRNATPLTGGLMDKLLQVNRAETIDVLMSTGHLKYKKGRGVLPVL